MSLRSRKAKAQNCLKEFEIPNNDQSRRASQDLKHMQYSGRQIDHPALSNKLQELAAVADKDIDEQHYQEIIDDYQDDRINENLTTDQVAVELKK